jgi:hypothetical protein
MKACESRVERAHIDRHFAGRISAADEQRMRTHLADCADCQRYYERHLVLAEIDPGALTTEQRIAGGLGLSPRRASPLLPVYAGVSLAVCGLALLLFAPWKGDEAGSDEFMARGAALTPAPAELVVYRVQRGSAPERVEHKIKRSDELMFAYRNDKGFRYLCVFAVDESKQVYWYYPGWSDPNTTPEAVSIGKTSTLVELPDAVSHELTARKLRLFAVFSDTSRSVRDVEERVKSFESARAGPLFQGTFELVLPLEVE